MVVKRKKGTQKRIKSGGIEDLEDNEDAYDEFIRRLATDSFFYDGRYSLKSFIESFL